MRKSTLSCIGDLVVIAKCVFAAMLIVGLYTERVELCFAQQPLAVGYAQEPSYKCDTDGVRLEGRLMTRMFYGPPGFGETPSTDLRDKVLVLKLAKPVRVEPIENAKAKNSTSLNTFNHIREIQLFSRGTQDAEVRKLVGKTVVAVGTLQEANAPRQYTDVTMDVKTISLK